MIVIRGYRHKLRQTFTKPHGNVPFHIDSKRFKSFLQATNCKVAQAADILTKINPSHLRQAHSTHWDKTWGVKKEEIKNLWQTFLSRGSANLVHQLTLTFPNFNFLKSHLWAWVTDQHFSIECEHDVHLSQINHTTNYIAWLPLTAEEFIANMPSLSLEKEYMTKSSKKYNFKLNIHFYIRA